jgi:hypothetical protein
MDCEQANALLQETSKHPFLRKLIEEESKPDAPSHFSLFVVSLHPEQAANFGDLRSAERALHHSKRALITRKRERSRPERKLKRGEEA